LVFLRAWVMGMVDMVDSTKPAVPRLLVVEDDRCICYVLESILGNAGFDVTVVGDGQKAWECIENSTYDLILMDLGVPEINGEELCAKLRARSHCDATPVILVSSKVFEIDVEYFKQNYGVAEVFGKPFSGRRLLASIREVLNPSTPVA
jgi:DNA-binding response OmpR family regulator